MYCLIFTAFQEKKYSFKTVFNTGLFQTFNTAVIYLTDVIIMFLVDERITLIF